MSASFVPNLALLPFLAQLQQKVALIRWTILDLSKEKFIKIPYVFLVKLMFLEGWFILGSVIWSGKRPYSNLTFQQSTRSSAAGYFCPGGTKLPDVE